MKLTDHILKKYDVKSALVGNRFVIKKDGGYHVARLNKSGSHDSLSVKVGSTVYPELVKALRAIDAPLPALTHNDTVALIGEWLEANNALAASHVYGEQFIVGKVHPLYGWRYSVAKLSDNGIVVEQPSQNFSVAVASLPQGAPRYKLDKLPSVERHGITVSLFRAPPFPSEQVSLK